MEVGCEDRNLVSLSILWLSVGGNFLQARGVKPQIKMVSTWDSARVKLSMSGAVGLDDSVSH